MSKSDDPWMRYSAAYLAETFGRSQNVEDLITGLQSRISSLKGTQDSEGGRRVTFGTLTNIYVGLYQWFREIRAGSAPTYAMFADKVVNPGDVIITFNYDDSLERREFATWGEKATTPPYPTEG